MMNDADQNDHLKLARITHDNRIQSSAEVAELASNATRTGNVDPTFIKY